MSAELAGMVLKCNKTGKFFFSHKEAEVHGEETGLADFSQVSLEERLWICTETGKWCFSEMEMDLHKKRVPEAQTFEMKTVADLKAAHEARKNAASSSADGDPMETEEDAILRQAGVKGKRKAAEEAGPPVVTKETVEQLVEMGFSELRAQKALVKTSNAGIEGAINWLTEHLEDADIDDPIGTEIAVKTAEELGQEMAEKMAGGGSKLTAEEKKAKADELLARARAKKAGITVEEEKEKERARRVGGQETVKSKRELEEAQRKRDMEARKREKREFELERQKLREKIEAEKAEKRANGTLVAAAPAAAASAAPAEAEKKKAPPPPLQGTPPMLVTTSATRDPHLTFAHGGRADLKGEHNTWYNMLSAKNTSVNVLFQHDDFHNPMKLVHGSKMGRISMVVRTALTGQLVTIDFNATLAPRQRATVRTNDGERFVDHTSPFHLENLDIAFREKKMPGNLGHSIAMAITTGKWKVEAYGKHYPNAGANPGKALLNVLISATYDADHDVVAPHGIIGQSYDGDSIAVDGAQDNYSTPVVTTAAMAEGAIEGKASDYKMPGPFATEFKFSRFDATQAKPRDVTKLTGKKVYVGPRDPTKPVGASPDLE